MAMQLLFLRGNTAQNDAYTGPLGSITIDTQARRIRLHNGSTVGGFAQLANLEDLQGLQTQIDNLTIADIAGLQTALDALQTAIDDEEAARIAADSGLDGRLTTVEGAYIKKDGTVAFTGNQSMGTSYRIVSMADPVDAQDAATKKYVDDEITGVEAMVAALGNAFNYVGTLSGGVDVPGAFDLDTLAADGKDAGDYYKVTTAGYFKVGAGTEFYANVGDGIVWNTSADVDKIDNTNAEVQGTADYVSVTGSADSGFVVDIASTFKTRMTTAEGDITALEGATSDLQTELDDTQAGAGLGATGTYTAHVAANYIAGATSLHNADSLLDAAIKSLSDTVDTITAGSVISVSGTAPIVVDNSDQMNPSFPSTLPHNQTPVQCRQLIKSSLMALKLAPKSIPLILSMDRQAWSFLPSLMSALATLRTMPWHHKQKLKQLSLPQ